MAHGKIAITKAALCYGFAIALRALFLGILCSLIATLALAITQEHVIASEQRASVAKQGYPARLLCRIECTNALAMTMIPTLPTTDSGIWAKIWTNMRIASKKMA